MKYMVMECHESYAVLMDEDACFVRAANLHYNVGQTVTDPLLLNEETSRTVITHSVLVRATAAAACMVLLFAGGIKYYSRNLKTQSVMTIGSDLKIEMELNSKGKVIRVNSDTADGKDLLESYKVKSKDITEAVNDLAGIMKDKGYITEDETLDLYIDTEDNKTYKSYKNELEQEVSEAKLNVQDIVKLDKKEPPTAVEAPTEPPKPTHEDKKDKEKPEPPKPPHEEGATPPMPPEPPSEGDITAPKPDDVPTDEHEAEPPKPSHEDKKDKEKPEPPKPNKHPGKKLPHEENEYLAEETAALPEPAPEESEIPAVAPLAEENVLPVPPCDETEESVLP